MEAGEHGPAVAKAMEILVALGEIYGARQLVPVASVQVAGVSYGSLGQAGLNFIRAWADRGARVVVPTTLNPAGMDLEAWRELGVPEPFAARQLEVIEAYRAMGIGIGCSCTPYLAGNKPDLGEHLAWSESSAVSYANSVLGARTNREGGPSALAAAITGLTPAYGLHLERNRQATLVVDVQCGTKSVADFGALGYLIGRQADDSVPYLRFETEERPGLEELKTLGAAMAASGAVGLYHVEGITPEARLGHVLKPDLPTLTIASLDEGYRALNSPGEIVELVWIGCPHASLLEIEQTANRLNSKELSSNLWVIASREVVRQAQARGLTRLIEGSGGKVVADACLLGAPLAEMGVTALATNSAKAAFYLRSRQGVQVRFGSLERCVDAAVTGVWPS
jgi:predicted aconitase